MRFPVILLAVLAALPSGCGAGGVPAEMPATVATGAALPRVPVTLATAGGVHIIQAEVARTADQQARGLMFREALAPDQGMIFPMAPARPASFWMKNTLIPLDIIFIRADGSIARIAERTTPHSLDPIESGEPVAAVLEIAGGRAQAIGLSENDRVSWPQP